MSLHRSLFHSARMSNSVNYRASRRDVFSISRGSDHSRREASQMADEKANTKRCSKCRETKPQTAFSPRADRKSGLYSSCKECGTAWRREHRESIRAKGAEWKAKNKERTRVTGALYHAANRDRLIADRKANPEKDRTRERAYTAAHRKERLAATADWRRQNPDKTRAASKRYRLAHMAKIRAANAAWYAANKDKVRVAGAEYYALHGERIRANAIAWAAANPERHFAKGKVWRAANVAKCRAAEAKYRAANPEVPKVAQARHRARKMGAQIGDRKAYARFVKWARAAPSILCYWCSKVTRIGKRNLDHVIPLARGGPDSVGNLCVSCPKCNQRKNAKLPEDFSGQSELRFA